MNDTQQNGCKGKCSALNLLSAFVGAPCDQPLTCPHSAVSKMKTVPPLTRSTITDWPFQQPQRPLRALRTRDENALPQLPVGKVLKQGKSMSALNSLSMPAGALRPAAKRAPFADVSNTTRQTIAKDDLHLAGKKKDTIVLKDPPR